MTDTDRSTVRRLVRQVHDDPEGVTVEPIVAALDHRDDSVRELATTALYGVSKTRPERVLDTVPQLAHLLDSDRPTLRNKAIMTMVNAGKDHPDALMPYTDEFVELLDDESASVRRSAARALRLVTTEDGSTVTAAIPKLATLLNSELESSRVDAVAILEQVATNQPDTIGVAIEPLLDVLDNRHESPSEITYDPKLTTRNAKPTDQMRGYRLLTAGEHGRSGSERAREKAATTIAALAADDPTTTSDVLEPHLSRLFDLLRDRNPIVRGTVVEILAYVAEDNSAAVRPVEDDLVGLLEDPIAVSRNAVWALRFVGSRRALEALRKLANDDTVDGDLRATAENALAAGASMADR